MNFTKAFFLINIHTIIKILCGIITNKVVAVFLGPSGLALIGQFQNFSTIVRGIANGSIQTGIVKYTSEYKDNQSNLTSLIKNSSIIMLTLSALVSVIVFAFSEFLSTKILFSSEYSYVFYLLSSMIIFYSLNLYYISIINGLGEIRLFTTINIVVSIFKLIFTCFFIYFFNLKGVFIALILVEFFVFIYTYYCVYKKFGNQFFISFNLKENFDSKLINRLFKFSYGTFSSAFLFAGMMLLIRYILINNNSLESAGIWESGFRIVIYFNMLFSLPYSVYFLPKFSQENNYSKIKFYLLEGIKTLLPLMFILGIIIIILKKYIVQILFANEFLPVIDLIPFLIFAEILRLMSSFISNIFTSKSMIHTTVSLEFVFVFVFVILSYFLISKFDILGVAYSYCISSFIVLIIYYFLFLFNFSKNE